MNRRRNRRSAWSFAVVMTAALAFIVGAVRLGGIPASQVTELLVTAFILVAGLALLALLTVGLYKLVKHWMGR